MVTLTLLTFFISTFAFASDQSDLASLIERGRGVLAQGQTDVELAKILRVAANAQLQSTGVTSMITEAFGAARELTPKAPTAWDATLESAEPVTFSYEDDPFAPVRELSAYSRRRILKRNGKVVECLHGLLLHAKSDPRDERLPAAEVPGFRLYDEYEETRTLKSKRLYISRAHALAGHLSELRPESRAGDLVHVFVTNAENGSFPMTGSGEFMLEPDFQFDRLRQGQTARAQDDSLAQDLLRFHTYIINDNLKRRRDYTGAYTRSR